MEGAATTRFLVILSWNVGELQTRPLPGLPSHQRTFPREHEGSVPPLHTAAIKYLGFFFFKTEAGESHEGSRAQHGTL